jgi:hypothetical protein
MRLGLGFFVVVAREVDARRYRARTHGLTMLVNPPRGSDAGFVGVADADAEAGAGARQGRPYEGGLIGRSTKQWPGEGTADTARWWTWRQVVKST